MERQRIEAKRQEESAKQKQKQADAQALGLNRDKIEEANEFAKLQNSRKAQEAEKAGLKQDDAARSVQDRKQEPGTGPAPLPTEGMETVAQELYELYELENESFMDVYGFLAFCELLDPTLTPTQVSECPPVGV